MKEDMNHYYNGIATFMGQTFGGLYEIYLFDMDEAEHKLIAAYNQGENIEKHARKFFEEAIETETYKKQGFYVGHLVTVSKDTILKMSLCSLMEGEATSVALVICMHCNTVFKMEAILSSMLTTTLGGGMTTEPDWIASPNKDYSGDSGLEKISEYIENFGIERGRTKAYEREEIICDLYDLGIFNYKGAVQKVAEELGISDKSVYRCLAKIRALRG